MKKIKIFLILMVILMTNANADFCHRAVAMFDFDQTLVKKNSLGHLWFDLYGKPKTLWLGIKGIFSPSKMTGHEAASLKRRIKLSMLDKFYHGLAGQTEEEIREAAKSAAHKLKSEINDDVINALEDHRRKGHFILVVSASPRVYIETLLSELGIHFDGVLATEFKVAKDCRLTGDLISPVCEFKEKVKRITEYFSTKPNLKGQYAYGNAPADIPMMEMVPAGNRFNLPTDGPNKNKLTPLK